MSTSGTTSFTLDVDEIITEAYEHIGGLPMLGYDPRTARRSLNLLQQDLQNRAILLWKIPSSPVEQATTADDSDYTIDASYLDVIDASCRLNDIDIPMQRLSFQEWLAIANKEQTGRPTQYYVNRQRSAITIHVWPIPNTDDYTIVYWPIQRLEDTSSAANNIDMPERFLPAIVLGLAYFLSFKRSGVSRERREELKIAYGDALIAALQGDAERASFMILPTIRAP